MALAMMPAARVAAPRLAARAGALRTCVLGLLLITAGLLVISRLDGDSSYWLLLAGLLPLGAGMGLAMTPATAAITDALPEAKQGVGSAMNDLARELGGALGIAVLGSLLQSTYRSHLHLPGVPAPSPTTPARPWRSRHASVPRSPRTPRPPSPTACSSPWCARRVPWPSRPSGSSRCSAAGTVSSPCRLSPR